MTNKGKDRLFILNSGPRQFGHRFSRSEQEYLSSLNNVTHNPVKATDVILPAQAIRPGPSLLRKNRTLTDPTRWHHTKTLQKRMIRKRNEAMTGNVTRQKDGSLNIEVPPSLMPPTFINPDIISHIDTVKTVMVSDQELDIASRATGSGDGQRRTPLDKANLKATAVQPVTGSTVGNTVYIDKGEWEKDPATMELLATVQLSAEETTKLRGVRGLNIRATPIGARTLCQKGVQFDLFVGEDLKSRIVCTLRQELVPMLFQKLNLTQPRSLYPGGTTPHTGYMPPGTDLKLTGATLSPYFRQLNERNQTPTLQPQTGRWLRDPTIMELVQQRKQLSPQILTYLTDTMKTPTGPTVEERNMLLRGKPPIQWRTPSEKAVQAVGQSSTMDSLEQSFEELLQSQAQHTTSENDMPPLEEHDKVKSKPTLLKKWQNNLEQFMKISNYDPYNRVDFLINNFKNDNTALNQFFEMSDLVIELLANTQQLPHGETNVNCSDIEWDRPNINNTMQVVTGNSQPEKANVLIECMIYSLKRFIVHSRDKYQEFGDKLIKDLVRSFATTKCSDMNVVQFGCQDSTNGRIQGEQTFVLLRSLVLLTCNRLNNLDQDRLKHASTITKSISLDTNFTMFDNITDAFDYLLNRPILNKTHSTQHITNQVRFCDILTNGIQNMVTSIHSLHGGLVRTMKSPLYHLQQNIAHEHKEIYEEVKLLLLDRVKHDTNMDIYSAIDNILQTKYHDISSARLHIIRLNILLFIITMYMLQFVGAWSKPEYMIEFLNHYEQNWPPVNPEPEKPEESPEESQTWYDTFSQMGAELGKYDLSPLNL